VCSAGLNHADGGELFIKYAGEREQVIALILRYLEDRDLFRDHVFLLGMFSLLGQLIMISGNHFLTLYLGLELMSLSLYTMIALRSAVPQSSEAAMKYYVLGALATGFLLYGISMLYGATGSLELNEVLKAVASGRVNDAVLLFGVIFIVAGVAFVRGHGQKRRFPIVSADPRSRIVH